MDYTGTELRILWYLKKNGPLQAKSSNPKDSVVTRMVNDLGLKNAWVRASLRNLERRCIILKTYAREIKQSFSGNQGYNAIMGIELIDPDMDLPACPAPLPLAIVVAHENADLYERTTVDPSPEAILEALLNRITELQVQVDKLQDIVAAQADQLAKASANSRRTSDHLTSRIRDVLPADTWDRLTHGEGR